MADPERVDLRELESELKAQIKTFQNATGGTPDHVDAHHFVHLLPRFFELYLGLAAQFNLPARLPLLAEGEALPLSLARLPEPFIRNMAAADRALAQAKDVRGPDRLLFFAGDDCLRLPYLLDLLQRLPEGTSELMVHPGLADETLRAQSSYAEQRERELVLLCNPALRRAIAALEIELVTFASLPQ